jgi:hypothetical protein
MPAYISGSPDPPYHALNLSPLYLAGLWLAVTTTPPRSLRRQAVKEIVCDGVGALESTTRNPLDFSVSATNAANSRERNRRSNPTTSAFRSMPSGGCSVRAATAMASLTRRTLSNVNPSAMTALHPSVPNVIACGMRAHSAMRSIDAEELPLLLLENAAG